VEKSRILIFAVFFIPTIIVTLSSRLGISLPPVSTIELIYKNISFNNDSNFLFVIFNII
jgi:hypothetical protein